MKTASNIVEFQSLRRAEPFRRVVPKEINKEWSPAIHPIYHYPTDETALNTFKYLFYKFKKGIFVQIRDGKIAVFLPFDNQQYVNEWSHLLKIPLEL